MIVDGKCEFCGYEQHLSLIDDRDENSLPLCCSKNQDEWLKENATVSKDGDQVCVLIGEDLQSGHAGFGDTRDEAICDLVDTWLNEIKTK